MNEKEKDNWNEDENETRQNVKKIITLIYI
jgi:hypothetical protein